MILATLVSIVSPSWISNTLGSVAGSVLGSVVQNHYNSANAAQANEWNVENYKHRYQDRKSTRLNSSHRSLSRMPSSA